MYDGYKESRIQPECTDGVDVSEGYETGIRLYRTFECGEVESYQYADQQPETGQDLIHTW